MKILRKRYAGERLNLSKLEKVKVKWNNGVMTKLSAFDATYSLRDESTSTYTDNGIPSCFNLFP